MLWTFLINISNLLPVFFANSIQNILFLGERNLYNEVKWWTIEYRSIASCIAKTCSRELIWNPTVVLKFGNKHNYGEIDFNFEMQKELTALNVLYVVTTDGIFNSTSSAASYLCVNFFKNCDAMAQFDFNTLKKRIKYINVIKDFSQDICNKHFKFIGNVVGEYDISFLVKQTDKYNLYTFIPYIDPHTCRQEVNYAKHINTCTDGEFIQKDIFPQKNPTNLKKCPFKVGMGSLYPFAMIENKSALQSYDALDGNRVKGLDYEIVKIMTAYFNATLELHYVYKQEENPFVNIEFLKLVLNGSVEACAGGLYRIFGDEVEYSGIYARQSVMWIYYAERVTRTWENMVVNIDGLYLFLVVYFSYSVAWFFTCKFDKYSVSMGNTLLYSWGALIGSSSLQNARTKKQKFLNIIYLNLCLHLSVYISIQLFSFFTIRGPPQMFKTNEDIMNSGRTAYLKNPTKYFIIDENYERFANTSVDCNDFLDCAKVSLTQKGMTVYIQGYFYDFQASTAVNDEARMLRSADNLLTVYYEMIIRRESSLVLEFQKIVVRLFEAGITDKLYNEAIGVTMVGKAKIATKNMVASSYSCQAGCTLSLRQFSGVFFIWGLGCVISSGLLTIEILLNKNTRSI